MLSSFKSLKSSPEVFFIKLGCLFDRAITSLAQLQASFDINFLTTRTRTHPFLHLSLEVGEAGEEHRWTLAKNSFLLLLPLDASVWSNNGFMKSSLRHKTKVMKYNCFFSFFFFLKSLFMSNVILKVFVRYVRFGKNVRSTIVAKTSETFFKKKMGQPQPLFYLLSSFQTTLLFLQRLKVTKCHDHPVYGTGIRTHDLWNASLLP